MSLPAVEFRGISMRFGAKQALKEINLEVEEGAYLVLLGPSGGGKTTLLNILGGFLEPTAGQVLIKGKDVTAVPPAKRPTTTVFQDYALFPHMSVAANVAFGLKMRKVPSGRAEGKGGPGAGHGGAGGKAGAHAPMSFPVASASVSHWPVPWWWNRRFCCWTSLWAPWISSCGAKCRQN